MKKRKYPSHIRNKWAKMKVLNKSGALSKYIPSTRLMSKSKLRSMLRKYGMVYVKPCFGLQGRGVIKMERREASQDRSNNGKYRYQLGKRIATFATFKEAFRSIRKITKGERYMIQKGIRLLTYDGRPFDLRIMVQKRPGKSWKVTGSVARVAHPHKIVTNGSQGGTIYPVSRLVKTYASSRKWEQLNKKMKRIGLAASRQLRRYYPGVREIGLDIALGRRLKPWILEANTNPDPCPFTKLKSKKMLRRIIRFAKAYGRTYKLNCVRARSGR